MHKSIAPNNIDFAVKESLTNSNISWSDTDKLNARNQLNVVGRNDIATVDNAGIIKVNKDFGINIMSDTIYPVPCSDNDIETETTNNYRTLQARHTSKIVKQGLTNSSLIWTDEDKTIARECISAERKHPNPNLLDNEAFKLNLRGKTTYDISIVEKPFVIRWRKESKV